MKNSLNIWGKDVTVTLNENGFLILRSEEAAIYIDPETAQRIRAVLNSQSMDYGITDM